MFRATMRPSSGKNTVPMRHLVSVALHRWPSGMQGIQFLCPSSGVFHCTHSNGICHSSLLTACEQEQMLCVQWKTPDDGQTNCMPCIPDSHLCRATNTRCRIGTVFSADDGHIVARNMYRKAINILCIKKICAPSWFYLQKIIQGCRSTKHKILE